MVQFLTTREPKQPIFVNTLSTKPLKWPNKRNLLTNCLSVFDHFVGFALKGLRETLTISEMGEICHFGVQNQLF